MALSVDAGEGDDIVCIDGRGESPALVFAEIPLSDFEQVAWY